jgi:hypothetical protein
MGLDWNPGPKAKSGCEPEFRELWHKLHSRSCFFRAKKVKRFKEITTTAFDTLRTPRVGFDSAATQWALQEAFPKRQDKSLTEEIFIAQMKGFYVLDLVLPCDGIPRYSNGQAGGYLEPDSFRGQFLKDSEDVIGAALLESAWNYGNTLLECAERYAAAHGIDTSKCHLAKDEKSPDFQVDIVLAAGRWCRFWGERGHWLEAYS